MAFDDMGMRELAVQGAAAGGLGMLGRLLALARASARPTGWSLLWEVPIACGMGIIGKGVAEYLEVGGFQHYAVVIAVAYTGPRLLDIWLANYYASKLASKTTQTKKESN
jgi:hypothetical protein